ncbi:MAG: hypothetical protein ACLQBY_13375 [Solirubrobacteraceae bacterium]
MSIQVEQDLRLALAERAAELPSDASARLLSFDYHPCTPRTRPALALLATTVTASAVLAISLVGLGTDTPRAFAGWSATPTAAVGDQAQNAEAACLSRLPTSAGIEHAQETASGPHGPWPIPDIPAGGWHTVLIDTRGPYTVILFEAAGGRAQSSCFTGRQPVQASLGGGFGAQPPAPVPAGQVSIVSSGSNTTPPDEGSDQFSRLVGRTGAGVSGVTLRLSDGTQVTASCADGWFLAWWPGTQPADAAEVTTPAGPSLQQLTGPTAMARRAGTHRVGR